MCPERRLETHPPRRDPHWKEGRRVTERRFNETYEAYAGRIYRYCLFITNSRQEAEDLTSETFIRLLANGRTPDPRSVLPWLYKVAKNLSLNHLRREAGRRFVARLLGRAAPPESGHRDEPWRDGQTLDAVRRLKHRDQQVVFLRVFEDLSFSEVADALGMSEAAAKMAFHRSLRVLQGLLEGRGGTPAVRGEAGLKGEHCGT
jgi:RNA polymerase sigma-70 factor, ECF subfamily